MSTGSAVRSSWSAVVALLLAGSGAPLFAQADWTKVVDEGGSFTLPAAKLVRYGNPWTPAWTAERSMTGTVACTNVTFGDPSPGTGKQCQTKDIAAPAPSPILPPLTSGETYVVSWTPPTTNVDGSPIGTVLRYLVHASSTPAFATYYQWESTTRAASYTAKFAPAGVLHWRVAVETSDGTSDYSATAITERQAASQNVPACWPKPFGCGSFAKVAQNTDGVAILWQYQEASVWKYAGFCARWSQMDVDWAVQFAVAAATNGFGALWGSRITGICDAERYPTIYPMYVALKTANPLPAAPTYRVAPNGVYTSRPAYALAAGSRTQTVVGRVAVAAPCDCAAHRSGTGSSTYCAVTGQLNIATADPADRVPASAAICALAP